MLRKGPLSRVCGECPCAGPWGVTRLERAARAPACSSGARASPGAPASPPGAACSRPVESGASGGTWCSGLAVALLAPVWLCGSSRCGPSSLPAPEAAGLIQASLIKDTLFLLLFLSLSQLSQQISISRRKKKLILRLECQFCYIPPEIQAL